MYITYLEIENLQKKLQINNLSEVTEKEKSILILALNDYNKCNCLQLMYDDFVQEGIIVDKEILQDYIATIGEHLINDAYTIMKELKNRYNAYSEDEIQELIKNQVKGIKWYNRDALNHQVCETFIDEDINKYNKKLLKMYKEFLEFKMKRKI